MTPDAIVTLLRLFFGEIKLVLLYPVNTTNELDPEVQHWNGPSAV